MARDATIDTEYGVVEDSELAAKDGEKSRFTTARTQAKTRALNPAYLILERMPYRLATNA